MDKSKLIEAIHIGGSVASLTAIALLALGSTTTELQFASILAYAMSASILVGVLGLIYYGLRGMYSSILAKVGGAIAVLVYAIIIPLTFWLVLYLVLFLKSLASYEFLWIIEQLPK
ncbi:hypothetical protein Q4488_12590 [Amphritea sp. 1_MG-2023]|uniref:hypothetical protein n=1 Tax=Amphritea sp. 1_MG-2023 TaxID=3062670 RepID=UPI0026E26867|nr:hypothetical protein [Amphritea sp. 1_MG-2023]MDO6564224.1 hypothetical protein [Amphritea sp. 1_MG-2023]